MAKHHGVVIMENTTESKPRLLDRVRELIRIQHCRIRTEQAYSRCAITLRHRILFIGKNSDHAVWSSQKFRRRVSASEELKIEFINAS